MTTFMWSYVGLGLLSMLALEVRMNYIRNKADKGDAKSIGQLESLKDSPVSYGGAMAIFFLFWWLVPVAVALNHKNRDN